MSTRCEEALLGLLILTEIDLATTDVIEEDGIIDVRPNARLIHLLHCRDGHHQRTLIVALDQQELRESAGTFVIAQLILFGLHLTLDGLAIVDLRHTVMALMVIGHTSPTIGIEFGDQALLLVSIGQYDHAVVLHPHAHVEQDTVSLAGPHLVPHTFLTGNEDHGHQEEKQP